MIYNYKAWFTLKDSVMDPSYDGPDMTCAAALRGATCTVAVVHSGAGHAQRRHPTVPTHTPAPSTPLSLLA